MSHLNSAADSPTEVLDKSDSGTELLDEELKFETLSHLPTKSLMKFKRVSKDWNSIICNPSFAKKHSTRGGSFRGLLLVDFPFERGLEWDTDYISTVYYANWPPEDSKKLAFSKNCNVDLRSFDASTRIVEGLIGFYNLDGFTLCNISTLEMVKLPPHDQVENLPRYFPYTYHLGFDSVHYKVLRVLNVEAFKDKCVSFDTQIFTVGKDRIWRTIPPSPPANSDSQSICLRGRLYWHSLSDVIDFDLTTETFRKIMSFPRSNSEGVELVNIGGRPAFIRSRVKHPINPVSDLSTYIPEYDDKGELKNWTTNTFSGLKTKAVGWVDTTPIGDMLVASLLRYPKCMFRYHLEGEGGLQSLQQIKLKGLPKLSRSSDACEESIHMYYHEENILAIAPLLSMKQEGAIIPKEDSSAPPQSLEERGKPMFISFKPNDAIDGFLLKEEVWSQFLLIKKMVKDDSCSDTTISLPNVTTGILSKVVAYCESHATTATATATEIVSSDLDFVKVDSKTLIELMKAASYLIIPSLLDLTCKTMSDIIKGMSVEEVREIFKVKNDFTPEEQQQIEKETKWAVDD